MKQILNLLNELDKKSDVFYYVRVFGDFSGTICFGNDDNEVMSFNNKKECIKELKRLLNERTK